MTDTTDLRAQLHRSLGTGYTLDRELGGGGMSRVFVAHDTALGRDVVVKVLSPELSASLSTDRFTREIRLAAALQEPHIVPVLAAGMTAEGLPYYTMPFVRGDSLRGRLDAGPIPLTDAIEMLRNVAQALSYAHARGIVHRDIKPENVLLSSGTAVVTDFGIAKALAASRTESALGTLTQAGSSVGTPAYMAPEQAAGDPVDARADVYAWGVLAYEVLGYQHPFANRTTAQQLIAAHIAESPRPLNEIAPTVPRELATLVMQCLAKSPDDRAADGAAVFAQLTQALVSSSRSTRSLRTKPVWSRLSVALVILAAVLAGGAYSWWRRAASSSRAITAPQAIAVLPFADLSADHASAYLGDGVAETLINALSKVAGLTVSARSSAFTFRGRENDLKAIGAQLGVSTVLVGGIQRAGDKLRITARAVRVANDSIIWSDNFDRPAADIFAVQDEVARAVVAAMRFSLAALPDSMLHVGGTKSTVAYDAYLRGRFFWNLRTTDGMVRATDAFKAAIAADSNYAQAWSGLADSYTLSTPDEYDVPGATYAVILPLAGAAARRAIAIAPMLGEAYSSLGEVLSKSERRADALAAFRKGVALSPSYATGHQWYSYELLANGLVNDAVSEMEVAHRLDPLSHVITLSLAMMYDAAERFGDAAPLYAQGLAQSPQAWYGWRGRFLHDLARGQMDSAAVTLQHVAQDPRYDPPNRGNIVRRMAPLFIKPTTRAIATDSIIRVGPAELSLALTRAFMGDTGTVTWMQRATIDPDGYDADQAMITNAVLGPRLRADPRIQASFRRLGFPDARSQVTRR